MRRRKYTYQLIACSLFLFGYQVAGFAQQPALAGKYASVNETRLRKIDVKHIALDLHFDWQHKQAYGTAAITLSSFKPTNRITLDAGMLTINSVVGSFENELGKFYVNDAFNGKEIIMLYQWDATDIAQPKWSQAFSDDDGKTWEWNWEMILSRIE